ncbi:MAG: transcription termination/antitermination protein NusA [Phycisphaerae bacterium]|nr:transcription termination/antitermination protein NusA [Phycisphaerae bacterium]
MNQDILRIVDVIAKERNIDRETVFSDLEAAMVSAARKYFGATDEVTVTIDRHNGQIQASHDGQSISLRDLGRIAAQTAKQVMIQKIREAERGSLYDEFLERKDTIVTGTVVRQEGSAVTVNLGRVEAFLPRSEQIPGETYQPGQRLRSLIRDVRETGTQLKIVLSRTHPDFIRRLFELEVPEVAEGIIEIKALGREAGYRTKVAVVSLDSKVDAVGACVGVRGSRIKSIVDEINGEKIDIVRWNESSTVLIGNALKPAEVTNIYLSFELGRATVLVDDEQLSLAIGKRGQNVRLAARLTGWDIDIITPAEYNAGIERLERVIQSAGVGDSTLLGKIVALGMVSVGDVSEVGAEPLMSELSMSEEESQRLVQACAGEAERAAVEMEKAKAEAKAAAAAASDAESAAPARFSARVGEETEGEKTESEPSEG